MKSKVAVSILNWMNEDATFNCIESVLKFCGIEQHQIFVLDNSHSIAPLSKIEKRFKNVNIIQSDSNLGFAKGHNQCMNLAKSKGFEFIWILNNDCLVFEDALGAFISKIGEVDTNFIFGSVIMNSDKHTVQYFDGYQIDLSNKLNFTSHDSFNIFKGKTLNQIESLALSKTSHVSGSSMFFPISMALNLGFMSFDFFLYYEETEWCFRLKNRFGVSSYIVRNSIVFHSESLSFYNDSLKSIKEYYVNRNAYFFSKRYRLDFKKISISLFCQVSLKYIKRSLQNFIYRKQNYTIESKFSDLSVIHSFLGIKGKILDPNNYV